MSDSALDRTVRIVAGKFPGIGAGVQMRRTIGIAFKRNGGHGDDGPDGKPLFQIVEFRVAFSQCEAPPIIVDHDGDVIGVVEGRCATIERRIIEFPLRAKQAAK